MQSVIKQPTELELKITGLTSDGLGTVEVVNAEHGTKRDFQVRNALPGETVRARILRRRKGKTQSDGVSVLEASPIRRASACENFPRCGGCSMHHMQTQAQLELKQQQLITALAEQGVEPGEWSAPHSAVRLGYRRKARLGVRQVGEQVFVGFRESFSNRVARITNCEVLTPELAALIAPLRELIAQLSIADKIPQIEVAQGDAECVLMVRHLEALSEADLVLWREFEAVHRVCVLLQSGGYDTLVPLDGGPVQKLGYQIPGSGLYMQFYPQQFTQVNLAMNLVLIRHVLAYLGNLDGKRVADMFCGIGNFTLPLARAGAKVWGYEAVDDAVTMARDNAALNGLSERTHFGTMDLYGEDAANKLPADLDALVLDPPRSGAGPNLESWLKNFDGAEIAYVSCSPQSFAADAARIVNAGFELSKVGIFDMFPNTAHVETVGYFQRQESDG